MKTIEIIGGGTVFHLRNHLALTAPAYGQTARQLKLLMPDLVNYQINLHLTKMANSGQGNLETNQDISNLLDQLIANPDTKIIFFNPALVDFEGHVKAKDLRPAINKIDLEEEAKTKVGKYAERLKTSNGYQLVELNPGTKLVSKIRKERKDIFLIAFKTTCGAAKDEQFLTGLHLLKSSSCNLVLANDTKTRVNMIITPEQARYCVTTDRDQALSELVEMSLARAELDFTRSTVVDGESVAWNDKLIPESLRAVVNHCIAKGAYKPFLGSTVGHFAIKIDNKTFLTSKRKSNFNKLDEYGLVKVEAGEQNNVIAFGAKPSVGGQSQRIVFKEHPEVDCIVHFHCMPKDESKLSIRSQKLLECGSIQCGQNTSNGLREDIEGIKCVYLDNHGPNIVFNKNIDPQKVINFIDQNFDLTKSTDQVDRKSNYVV